MSSPPPLPPSFHERLVATEVQAVDAETVEAIRRFCAASPEVDAAFVCFTERQHEGDELVTSLRLSFKLREPVNQPSDARASHLGLLSRLTSAEPDVAKALGCGVLADRAVPAWETNGVRVFSR
jgi:hypothetical protein